jgi:subtilisin family serine protease
VGSWPTNRPTILAAVPRLRTWIFLALLLVPLGVPTNAIAGREQPGPDLALATPPTIFSPDLVIVEWALGTGRADRVESREEADVSSVRPLGSSTFQLVQAGPGEDIGDTLATLRGDPDVQVAVRDSYSALTSIPNDSFFGELWGLRNLGTGIGGALSATPGVDVNAPLAWDRTVGSPAIVIADIDSGYRFDSPDLGPVAWTNPLDPPGGGDNDGNGLVDDTHGADFVGPSLNITTTDGDPTDDNLIAGGHGVHTAGTMGAAGNDGIGITGVAQNVRIMPLRVCSYYTDPSPTPVDESGTFCPTSAQIAAIEYAGSHGARVANMSLGGASYNQAVVDAIAANPELLLVISAGNDNVDNELEHHYPCDYRPTVEASVPSSVDNIVCVAATNQTDGRASFSDWGAVSVDLGAPGTETLSTYPADIAPFTEDFQVNDFSSKWTSTGAGFGRASSGDGPLTSFGMNDSPGGAPAAASAHVVTLTTGVAVPAGTGSCVLSGLRYRRADVGSSFSYSVLSDDVPVFTNAASTNTSGSSMAAFNTAQITGLGGHAVKVRFNYTAGAAPDAASGLWLDNLKLSCHAPLSTQPTYAFLQGTSMAAPHVTGAAGLLFSLRPAATVAQVRAALLAGTDPVPSLAGKTVTGGRLDVPQAMDALEQLTQVVGRSSVTLTLPVNPPAAVIICKVPKLAGMTLAKAKTALSTANCTLGKVTKPKAKKGKKLPALVVKSSTPAAGASPASGKVDLTLGKKPKPKKKHH